MAGHLTCADPIHQHAESHHQDKGQSRFQLCDCLQRAHDIQLLRHTTNSRALPQLAVADEEDVFDIDQTGQVTQADPHSPEVSTTTKTKLHAKFTRAQSHNKQLAIAPCRIILGRDTMFSAEGVTSIAVSWSCFYCY